MLINLTKHELSCLIGVTQFVIENDTDLGDGDMTNLTTLSNKLSGILDACECQAQKQTKEAN